MRRRQCWSARCPDRDLARAKIRRIHQFIRGTPEGAASVVATMSRSAMNGSNSPRGSSTGRTYYGPVLSIVLLLACWFIIGNWSQLPQLIDSTMAALP
jgi:hypothetical protein